MRNLRALIFSVLFIQLSCNQHDSSEYIKKLDNPEHEIRDVLKSEPIKRGHFEEYLSAMATVETVAKFKDDYDAFVIACYGDPGVSACREVTEKPVVGIGEASTLI